MITQHEELIVGAIKKALPSVISIAANKKIEDGIKEILETINKGIFTNYKDKIYYNYEFLNDNR